MNAISEMKRLAKIENDQFRRWDVGVDDEERPSNRKGFADRNERVLSRFEEGATSLDIQVEFNMTRGAVSGALRRARLARLRA